MIYRAFRKADFVVYLLEGEGGPVPALFAPDKGVFVDGRVVGVARVCHREN